MRKLVMSDQGTEEGVNRAVWATVAAVLLHSNLDLEAVRLAEAAEGEGMFNPSKAFKEAWDGAQQIRRWIQMEHEEDGAEGTGIQLAPDDHADQALEGGDVGAGGGGMPAMPPAGSLALMRSKSTQMQDTLCDELHARACLLLETLVVTPRVDVLESAALPSAPAPPKLHRAVSALGAADSASTPRHGGSTSASSELGQLLLFQKAAAAEMAAATTRGSASPLRSVVDFVKGAGGGARMSTDIIRAAMNARTHAGELRAAGIHLCARMMSSVSTPAARAEILRYFARAMRRLVAAPERAESEEAGGAAAATRVHVLSGIEGCSEGTRASLARALHELLILVVRLITTPLGEGGEGVQQIALLALAQDFNVGDAPMLHEVGVVQALAKVHAQSVARAVPESRTKADASLPSPGELADCIERVLLSRVVGMEDQHSVEALTSGSGQGAGNTTGLQSQLVSNASHALLESLDSSTVELAEPVVPVEAPVADVGTVTYGQPDQAIPTFTPGGARVLPGAPLAPEHTVSAWVWPPTVAGPVPDGSEGGMLQELLEPDLLGATSGADGEDTGGSSRVGLDDVEWVSSSCLGDMRVENKYTVTSGSDRGACRLSHGTSDGILKWKIKYVQDSRGNEHMLLGVSPETVSSTRYDQTASNMHVVRGYNGMAYNAGRSGSSNSELKFHPGEDISFELDMTGGDGSGVLKFTNSNGEHTLFTDLSGMLYPCVMSYDPIKMALSEFEGGSGGGASDDWSDDEAAGGTRAIPRSAWLL
jgi:hypothetical protein